MSFKVQDEFRRLHWIVCFLAMVATVEIQAMGLNKNQPSADSKSPTLMRKPALKRPHGNKSFRPLPVNEHVYENVNVEEPVYQNLPLDTEPVYQNLPLDTAPPPKTRSRSSSPAGQERSKDDEWLDATFFGMTTTTGKIKTKAKKNKKMVVNWEAEKHSHVYIRIPSDKQCVWGRKDATWQCINGVTIKNARNLHMNLYAKGDAEFELQGANKDYVRVIDTDGGIAYRASLFKVNKRIDIEATTVFSEMG